MKTLLASLLLVSFTQASFSQFAPFASDSLVRTLTSELSGETAKRNLEYVATLHRMRGSAQFKKAVDFIAVKLKEYNLEEIEAFQIPADGKIMYGTQKSRPVWEADFAELWEMQKSGNTWKPVTRIADYESMPIVLAEDSESGEVTAELIDVGAGTSEKDYEGKDVKGKLVLTSSSPSAIVALATVKYGAAGILSYTQNQRTAWWKEDINLVRWGHFNSFEKNNTFCFMLSIKQANALQQRLNAGEHITLHAKVKAGRHPGNYDFATAVIKGSDPKLREDEIAFTCHLDHQRPGANDNASGSMTILEIARTMKKLIDEKKLVRPLRTIRFIWSPEIEGTSALLSYRPAYASRIKAVVHMDMVGGGPVTKSIFHVAGAPKSLPSFVADVGIAFGQFVNNESDAYASGYTYKYSFASREGGKEPLLAVLGQFHMGSDHEVYEEGSFKIPAVYMHDWPDRYIHTNADMPANIDPTKLLRAGFIGAASAYVVANLTNADVPLLWNNTQQQAMVRTALAASRINNLPATEAQIHWDHHFKYERGVFASLKNFVTVTPQIAKDAALFYSNLAAANDVNPHATKPTGVVYKRNPAIKGPMSVFSYDYFEDHYGEEKSRYIRLLNYEGLWSSYYGYEALNFVDGKRTTSEIRDALSAEFGPVPMDVVEEFLEAMESIKVVLK